MSAPYTPRKYLDAKFVIHLLLTCVLLAMAIQLALPGDTFGGGGNTGLPAGNWRVVAAYMSEKTTAAALWSVGMVGVVGMATAQPWVKLGSIFVLSTVHGMLAGAFLSSNPAGVGAILLSGYALLGYYLLYRRTVEAA